MSNETTRVRALRASLMAALVAFACACALAFAAPQSAWADATSMPSASNGVITLTEDVTLSSTYEVTGTDNLTIDLAGYTITGPSSGYAIKVTSSGTTTIKNGTVSAYRGLSVSGAGTVTLENVVMTANGDRAIQIVGGTVNVKNDNTKISAAGSFGVVIAGNNSSGTYSTLNVEAGSIEGGVIGISGIGTYDGTAINISGGTVKGAGTGIYHPQEGTLTLTGGTIEGEEGVQMCDGTLNIPASSTVVVKATLATDDRAEKTGDGNIGDGAAISIIKRTGYGTPTATIAGGTFESKLEAVAAYSWDNNAKAGESAGVWTEAGSSVNVSGGTFSQPVADDLLASGLVNTSSNGTTFTPGSKDGMVEVKISEPLSLDMVATVYFASEDAFATYTKNNSLPADTPITYLKYTLTFDSQGGSEVESQVLKVTTSDQKGDVTTKPADPTRAGYAFKGWYTDKACTDGNEFTFGKELTEDTTVYAKWAQTHTVTFIVSTGGDTLTQTVEHGSTATQPTDPTLDGYTFVGWFADSAFTTAYDFSTPVTADTTIYGGWQENASSSDGSTDESTATAKSSSAKTGDASGAAAAALAGLALCSAGAIALARRKQD